MKRHGVLALFTMNRSQGANVLMPLLLVLLAIGSTACQVGGELENSDGTTTPGDLQDGAVTTPKLAAGATTTCNSGEVARY